MSEQAAIGKIDDAFEGRAARGASPDFTAGEALVQPALNRITMRGQVTQVEPKVMQVLGVMAARPGAVVPREDFLETVWAGTVGDDYLLNRAVSELRKVFDDDPATPRYIETIRKRGYRLVAPIAPARVAVALASHAAGAPTPIDAGPTSDPITTHAAPRSPARQRWRLRWTATIALVASLAVAALIVLQPWPSGPATPPAGVPQYIVQPLTSLVGREFEPALSPDGSRVAFIWDGGHGGHFDVHVKAVGSEQVLNLSKGDTDARHPLWTPDGRAILFARSDGTGSAILRVSALGGGVTRVFDDPLASQVRGMSLSPDGQWLAYAAREHAGAPYRIVLASLGDGIRGIVSHPAPGTLGDTDPRFSPDGDTIAFVRAVDEVTKDVFRTTPSGDTAVRLTFDNRKVNGLAWTADGTRLLFTSTRSGMYTLWSASPDGSDLQPVPLGNEDVHQPATATGSEGIVFEQWRHRSRLRAIDLRQAMALDDPLPLGSTRWDSSPAWSPDGMRIAFASNRDGPHAIWVSHHDGRDAVRVAGFDGSFIDRPAWSPDGTRIAFDGSPDGQTAIFTVAPDGGTPRRITEGPGDSRNAAWSRDGRWLYFESNRDGDWRIYAQAVDSATAVAITHGPSNHPRESADGRLLLFNKPGTPGLWSVSRRDWHARGGGAGERLLIAELEPGDTRTWTPSSTGIYFLRRSDAGAPMLSLFDPGDGSVRELLALSPTFDGHGFDLSPDESRLVFSEPLHPESDLRFALPR